MNNTTTLSRAHALIAAAEKATPGRWRWWTSNSWRRLRSEQKAGHTINVLEPCVIWHDKHPDCIIDEDDMAFIATARNDAPDIARALVEAVELLRETERFLDGMPWTMGGDNLLADLRAFLAQHDNKGD